MKSLSVQVGAHNVYPKLEMTATIQGAIRITKSGLFKGFCAMWGGAPL